MAISQVLPSSPVQVASESSSSVGVSAESQASGMLRTAGESVHHIGVIAPRGTGAAVVID